MAKRKPPTIAKLVDKAAVCLQLLVRLKAADDNGYVSCVTCGVTRHYKDGMQGGHFISRRYTSIKLLEEQIHTQCQCCNGPKRGAPVEYTLFMIDTYGREFVEELQAKKNETKKYSRGEILEITDDFKARIKVEEERVIG